MRTRITLVGHLGSDPITRDAGEYKVCSFSVATNRKIKGEDITDWFNVSAWGKLGELCQRYLTKGEQTVVTGSFEPREYEKDGEKRVSFDIRADEVHFVGNKQDPQTTTEAKHDADDKIPF